MSCLFCDLFETGKAADFQSEYFWARLDIHPVSPGHLILIPKRHVAKLDELRRDEEYDLARMRKRAVAFIESAAQDTTLRRMYEVILDARLTKNSLWFIGRTLKHPRFGSIPDGYNHVVNDGQAAGQTIMHLHWHIIPRYSGDVPNPKGGGRYVIPELGNYTEPR